jgi:uncharacterized protein DUF4873
MGEQRAETELPADEYDGPAVVVATAGGEVVSRLAGARTSTTGDDDGVEVEVRLRGHFEPLDGRFHWFGRIATHDVLTARHKPGSTVTLVTPHGRAEGRLSDVDPWGRFRISGTGRPPF